MQERLLARGSDAWNVIQDTFQPRLAATCPVSSDRKAVRFVTQTLNVVQQRISRLQQDGRPIRQEDALSACVALRPLGDTSDRKVFDTKFGENVERGIQLAPPAIYQHKIRPTALCALRILLLRP